MILSNITDLRSSVNHSISLPSYLSSFYKNIPVMTTEMLAQAYDVTPKQIRQNYANNRERFTEGKHFFSISGQDLKDFRLRVENFDSQISSKVRVLILWTKRGAARHAKMLNSDRAWDVFELLEETFFAVKPDRKPLEKRKEKKALPPAQRNLPAPAPDMDETPFLKFVEEIQSAHEEVRNILQPLMSNSFNLCLELGLELGRRSGMRSGSIKGMDPTRNLTDLLQHAIFSDLRQALIYPERHLADYANPGYALLGIVRQLNAR